MIITRETANAIVVLRLNGRAGTSAMLPTLQRMLEAEKDRSTSAVVLDLSGIDKIRRSGIAAFLQLGAERHRDVEAGNSSILVGLCGVTNREMAMMRSYGLEKVLPIFPKAADALNSPRFRKRSLVGTRAILLAGRQGVSLAPLTLDRPAMMLDMLGRPIADRSLDRLKEFGIRDIVMTPGHQAPRVINHFRARRDLSIFFSREGQFVDGTWRGMALGTAESLARLHTMHGIMDDDVIVIDGAIVGNIDFARMMQAHRSSGALLTVASQTTAKGPSIESASPLAFKKAQAPFVRSGVYVVSPKLFEPFGLDMRGDIGTHLLPDLRRRGGCVHIYEGPDCWETVPNTRAYVDLMFDALAGTRPDIGPNAPEIDAGIYADDGATIESGAEVSGPVFVASGARIESGARVIGPAVIGRDCRVSRKSLVRNSVLWDGTAVGHGAIVDTMVASGAWSVNHRFADGTLRPRTCLDGVTAIADAEVSPVAADIARSA